MSLLSRVMPRGPNGLGYGTTAEEATDGTSLSGRTVLVTGCSSGLGEETMRVLSLRGAHVIGTARTIERAQAAAARTGADATPIGCELSEPRSIRACLEAIETTGRRLDAIVCNAGLALLRPEVVHGYELQFLANHVGHFALVTKLLDRLTDDARVVVVSSDAHQQVPPGGIDFDNLDGRRRHAPLTTYGRSKLANILFANELSRRFAGTGRVANALHPGVVATGLTRNLGALGRVAMAVASPLALKSVAEGAATQCFLAASPKVAGVTGAYFASCNPSRSSALARDADLARRQWSRTEEIVRELHGR